MGWAGLDETRPQVLQGEIMPIGKMPPAEVDIDIGLVKALAAVPAMARAEAMAVGRMICLASM
jgi:hypothetical protein